MLPLWALVLGATLILALIFTFARLVTGASAAGSRVYYDPHQPGYDDRGG
jgi:hypothetical protein